MQRLTCVCCQCMHGALPILAHKITALTHNTQNAWQAMPERRAIALTALCVLVLEGVGCSDSA